MAPAERAFELLSDPMHLADFVPIVDLQDSTAVDGELDVDADLEDRQGAPGAGFVADTKSRRIDWGRPGADYGGSLVVAELTAKTARVTLRLRTRDDADRAEVERVVDATIANMRRVLAGR